MRHTAATLSTPGMEWTRTSSTSLSPGNRFIILGGADEKKKGGSFSMSCTVHSNHSVPRGLVYHLCMSVLFSWLCEMATQDRAVPGRAISAERVNTSSKEEVGATPYRELSNRETKTAVICWL